MGEEREYGSLEKRKISVCDWDDLERAGFDQAAQIWISVLKAMWSYWGIQNEDGWIRFTFKKNTCSREESVKIRTEKLDLTTKFCDLGQNRSRWRDGMTNFGNWKGSRAGKIKLHLVRPLHILKSPGKPTKNILGLKNNKTCLHAYSHIVSSPVDSVSIPGFHTYPDTEGGPMAAVLPPFSPPDAVLLSSLAGRTQRRLPSSEIWGQFRNTICFFLAFLGLSSGLFTIQTPEADQIDTHSSPTH